MFADRKDAGEKLGNALKRFVDKDTIVVAIPRGGVIVGYYVARTLNLHMTILVSRKLPSPESPEFGIGAIAEDGSTSFISEINNYDKNLIDELIQRQKAVINTRIKKLRKGKPFPLIIDKTVFLIDDGIAMGSTMKAAIKMCRNFGATKIIVASPVSGPEAKMEFGRLADEVVILETPPWFHAVAQVYDEFSDVSDDEVLNYLQ